MYRFLLSRQWVILTLVGLVLIPVMVRLGFWQLHRHEHKVAQNNQIARSLAADPVPVTGLTAPGREVAGADVWRQVSASGTYDTEDEVVVRRRTDDNGHQGYFVLTPLLLGDGRAVLVNRGWVPAGDDPMRFPDVPAAPSGKITVTGRLKQDETTAASGIKDTAGLPPRQVMLINSEQRSTAMKRPVLAGYIELVDPAPKDGPKPVAAPDHSDIGPHLAYAIQWWLFAGGVPVGWFILVRRERRERLAAATAPETATASAP